MTDNLKKQLTEFKVNHYQSADFESFFIKVNSLSKRFDRLKNKNKKNRVVLELYTTYLQAIETLFININASSLAIDYFPSALFITTKNLHLFVEDNFKKKTKISTWFFNNLVFSLFKKHFKQKLLLKYESLLKEVAKDYLDNYNLLNAYKHGYRISAKHEALSLSIRTKGGQNIKLNNSDSTIKYFSKEKLTIFEHSLNFNIERIFGKCLFVCALLNNIKAVSLKSNGIKIKSKSIATFQIDNMQKWNQLFGGSHFKHPIFTISKPKKKLSSTPQKSSP